MFKRIHRDEEGVALIVALALVGLASIMMVTMVSLALRENRQTSRDRSRAVAVSSAEGAVDLALTQIQQAAVGTLPCSSTVTNTQAKPETMTITTTVSYVDATGAALACPPPAASVAAQALIRAVSVATPLGGGTTVRRTVESLVALQPKFTTDLDKAIFGNAGVEVGNNFDLYGQSGPEADVYTNGSFVCSNNEHFRGSIYAQGSITLNNTCVIDVNAWAKTGFTSNDTQARVSGDVLVSNGTAAINAGTVGGKVKAVSITPASFCTSNPGKCVTGASAAAAPPAEIFPQIAGDETTLDVWRANGYTVVYKNDCAGNTTNNPGKWIAQNADSISAKTLVRTTCRVSFDTNVKTVSQANDLAVFADGGFDISNTITFQSTDTAKHYLYFIQPYGSSCASGGISLTNQVTVAPTISELLYSPCDVHKANQSDLYGQVYAGGTAYIDNKTNATYVPLPVFGAIATRYVVSYQADVLYKRENIG
jgi:hypothetical protein